MKKLSFQKILATRDFLIDLYLFGYNPDAEYGSVDGSSAPHFYD